LSTDTWPGSPTQKGHRRVKYVSKVEQISGLPPGEREKLRAVAERYCFRANDYYLELIDWDDPHDPIRQLVIPRTEELVDAGSLDASNEASNTIARGLQHKYADTVLMLCNEACGAYCRYCFRKRLFMDESDEVATDVSAAINYIAEHSEITDVLLSGGDPLLLSTRRLREIIEGLRAIPHVNIIRIGSKLPAFDPWRVLRDHELQRLLSVYSTPHKRIYLMAHFDHPRELTDPAIEGIACFLRCGLICANQCPLTRGVNDDPGVLAELYGKLSSIGCPPYYLFQCRPTAGNQPYAVPIARGWEIHQRATAHGSGLTQRARYVMSHETGKLEILAVDERHIYMRYHRAKAPEDTGKRMVCRRNDDACWLDELEPIEGTAGQERIAQSEPGEAVARI